LRHPLRDSRALIALILPALCAAPVASAEIFKCVAKDGTALYQNFPCQFDSIGWKPSDPQAETTTLMPSDARQAKPKAAPVNVGSTAKSADPSELRIGVTPDEVRAILGEPLEAVQDEGIGIEIWRYVDRTVQFDRTNRVVTLQGNGTDIL
jgi:hypothetical protein